ncbi:RNA polymerase sigma factor [Enterococcus mediterraneensis]|uniref:RNA polymerase sigma factor n=1 Tax=Enterococcus mediterraneensis TaxID=2364791 RepID=UPI000F0524E2|nr:sigma-70 family RNA polymerase sigma factor [Enterococcus mediterraneensis]
MSSDKKLVRRAKKGDGEAFVLLVKEQEQRLYNIAYKILGNQQDCGDVLQDTLLKAYVQITTLKNDTYFHTWLCRILINECKNLLEKKKRFVVADMETFDQENSILTSKKGESEWLREYVTKNLSSIYRIPLILYYYSGFSIKEISEILNEPVGTIKSKLARGKALLKQKLMEDEE